MTILALPLYHNRVLVEPFNHGLTDSTRITWRFFLSRSETFVQSLVLELRNIDQRVLNPLLNILLHFLVIDFTTFSKQVFILSIFSIPNKKQQS